MAIFAMEDPVSLNAEDIRNEKVKVLRSIRPINIEDVVLGQYKGRSSNGVQTKGYLEDPTVPEGSLCPTFAAIAYHIDNARWDGVPFLMKAGKALDKRCAQPHHARLGPDASSCAGWLLFAQRRRWQLGTRCAAAAAGTQRFGCSFGTYQGTYTRRRGPWTTCPTSWLSASSLTRQFT